MLLLFPMLAIVVAIVLIVFGLRGRRIGDHPVCRKCGFDLSGKPSASIYCAECGADLGEVDAVAYGQHYRHKGVLVTGLVMLVFFGSLVGSKVGTLNTLRYAPFRWVAGRARSADVEIRNAAHDEMDRRVLANALSNENWNQLADAAAAYRLADPSAWDEDWDDLMHKAQDGRHLSRDRWQKYVRALAHCAFGGKEWNQPLAWTELNRRTLDGLLQPTDLAIVEDELLACQADVNKPWNAAWGDWLEGCGARGQVDADRWARYIRQSLVGAATLRLRPKVRLGDPLPLEIRMNAMRAGSTVPTIRLSNVQLRWEGSSKSIALNTGDSDLRFDRARKFQQALVMAKDLPSGLSPGIQHVHLTASIESDWPNAPAVVGDAIEPAGSFELLPANVSGITTVQYHPSGLGQLIEFPPVLRVSGVEHRTVKCVVIVNNPPVGLAFDVILNSKDKSQIIGSFSFPAHAERNQIVLAAPWLLGDVDQVDVVLHSNPAAAVTTVDTIEVWNGDIPFTQVPVGYQ
jgi:hypothetical protein